MKKQNIIIIFVVGLFIAYSCDDLRFGDDFLEKAPGVDITKDTIFGNIKYTEDFLWGAYKTLPFGLNAMYPSGESSYKWISLHPDVLESITDLNQSYVGWGSAKAYYSGNITSSTQDNAGPKYKYIGDLAWTGIRKCWIIVENVDKVPDATQAYKNQLKAEAKVIIAVHYTQMLRHLGGVPWVDHAFTPNEDASNVPRVTASDVCDRTVALLDEAIPDLPWTLDDPATWDGRMTKASAMAVKARILLFNASPLFNADAPYMDGEAAQKHLVWHGSYNRELWKKAADAAHALIEACEGTGDYKLYHLDGNTYRQDFQGAYLKRGNGEVLISSRYGYKTSNTKEHFSFFASSGPGSATSGGGCVTDNYVQMFPMADGTPITDPASGYDEHFPYEGRDPRLYETVLTNDDVFQGRTAELWLGGRENPAAGTRAGQTGCTVRKFVLDGDVATNMQHVIQWPYIRLAEIYLSYAEAINEYDGGPSPEAYRCVNIVRNRVGLNGLPLGLSKEQFREAVLLERALEFGWEEVRWFDLIRWKREQDFTKTLQGVSIAKTTDIYGYSYTKFDLPERYWKTNFSPKWYLSAFPLTEINKRYGLIQNPGW